MPIKLKKVFMFNLFLFYLNCCFTAGGKAQKLIVILIDGVRWDYIEHQSTMALPGFNKIIAEGVRSKWVNPIFPSLSFPSWTTLSTGLYPENHNIIGNHFYDVETKDFFRILNSTETSRFQWWRHAEPVWITATKNRKRVATFKWSRSDVPYNGVLPDIHEGYTFNQGLAHFLANMDKIDQLIEEFDLIMVYTDHADIAGHYFGPISHEVQKTMREIDGAIFKLLGRIEQRGLDDHVNVMIVSDHGMTDTSLDSGTQYVNIDHYIDYNDILYIVDGEAVASVAVLPGRLQKVLERLRQMPGVDVYTKDDIPDKYHYRRGKYVLDILLVAKPGYFIDGVKHAKHVATPGGETWSGSHGYDDQSPDMRTVFLAKGPSFKSNYEGEPLDLVDIYQMYAHVLEIPTLPHNGTWGKVEPYLEDTDTARNDAVIVVPGMLLLLVAMIQLF